MSEHRSFPKPGKGKSPPTTKKFIKVLGEALGPKAKALARDRKADHLGVIKSGLAIAKKAAKAVKAAKQAKPKGPGKKKFPPVDEGLGTVFEPLTQAELAERALRLANQLHKREEEVEAQASTRSAMKSRLDEFDTTIHRLQIAIREKREEKPAPGLFDRLEEHKEKPLAKDTMPSNRKKPEAAKPKQAKPCIITDSYGRACIHVSDHATDHEFEKTIPTRAENPPAELLSTNEPEGASA